MNSPSPDEIRRYVAEWAVEDAEWAQDVKYKSRAFGDDFKAAEAYAKKMAALGPWPEWHQVREDTFDRGLWCWFETRHFNGECQEWIETCQ